MIKVLNIISDSNIGGAGRVLLNYLRYSDRNEFDTFVAVPKGSLLINPIKELEGKLLEVDGLAERSYNAGDVKLLTKLISELKPDIVHTHGNLSGRIAARSCGCKVIYTRHSVFPVSAKLKYPPGRWVNKVVNEYYADHIIAVSPAAAENLTDAGISDKYISIVMNGVAPLERSSFEKTEAFRKSYGIERDDFVLILLARIEEYKGHGYVVEAARMLKAQGRKFKVLFAGKGNYEDTLKEKVKKEGLEDVIIFAGFITDVATALSASDLQVNASFGTEATSLSLLEGFSIGLPAVVSSFGGNPYLIDCERNGIVFESKNSEALCKTVANLMDDKKKLSVMGNNAKEVYKERFSGEVFAKNVEDVYIKTIKGAW